MAIVYISNAGDDTTGAGTSVSPWKTISKAFTSSASGDTIHCLAAGGTFTWANQTFTSDRTIVGDGAATTIFDGAAAVVGWVISVASGVSVSDITFTNALNDAASHASFFDNNTSNSQWTFTNCIFDTLTAASNLSGILGVSGYAADPGVLTIIACSIINPTLTGASSALFGFGHGGIITVRNTTVYSNIANGNTIPILGFLLVGGSVATAELTNNIFWNANGTNKAWVGGGGFVDASTYTGSNNDILGYSGTPSLASQLSTDPLFVDASSKNFNLRPTSPCIDAGVII